MNNQDILYSPLKFKSEDDARRYFKKHDIDSYISQLHGQVQSLMDQSAFEVPSVMGHGYPEETVSGHTASYISAEATRLVEMQQYFNGAEPRPGYKWFWDNHGNQSIQQHLDLEGATPEHPVFLEYIAGNGVDKSRTKEVFDFWLDCHENPSMNKTFKLAYKFKMENLIPDKCKLFEMVTKPRTKHRRKK